MIGPHQFILTNLNLLPVKTKMKPMLRTVKCSKLKSLTMMICIIIQPINIPPCTNIKTGYFLCLIKIAIAVNKHPTPIAIERISPGIKKSVKGEYCRYSIEIPRPPPDGSTIKLYPAASALKAVIKRRIEAVIRMIRNYQWI